MRNQRSKLPIITYTTVSARGSASNTFGTKQLSLDYNRRKGRNALQVAKRAGRSSNLMMMVRVIWRKASGGKERQTKVSKRK